MSRELMAECLGEAESIWLRFVSMRVSLKEADAGVAIATIAVALYQERCRHREQVAVSSPRFSSGSSYWSEGSENPVPVPVAAWTVVGSPPSQRIT